VFQLGQMIYCTHGWTEQLFPFKAIARYSNYGCFCGVITGGDPKDDLDNCCKRHDACYEKVYEKFDLQDYFFDMYLKPYEFECNYETKNITCPLFDKFKDGDFKDDDQKHDHHKHNMTHPTGSPHENNMTHPTGSPHGDGMTHPTGSPHGDGMTHPTGSPHGDGMTHSTGSPHGDGMTNPTGSPHGSPHGGNHHGDGMSPHPGGHGDNHGVHGSPHGDGHHGKGGDDMYEEISEDLMKYEWRDMRIQHEICQCDAMLARCFNRHKEQYNIDHSHLDHPEECMKDPFQEAIDMFIKIFMNRFAIDDQLP